MCAGACPDRRARRGWPPNLGLRFFQMFRIGGCAGLQVKPTKFALGVFLDNPGQT